MVCHYARKPYKWLWFLGYISSRPITSEDMHQCMSDEDLDRLELDDADDYIHILSLKWYHAVHNSFTCCIQLI